MCNQRYRDLYFGVAELLVPGQRREEILRVHAAQGYVLASSVDPEEWLRERLARAREPRLECEQQRADGSWVKINERRTHDGGVVGIHTDITELKRREADLQTAKVQAEAASRAKSDFLAMMTHELRTPLNAVIGFSDIMRQELLGPVGNDQYKAYLQDVYASSNHLLEIINDILDIAKVEAGEMELREENLKLDVEVAFCQRTVEDRARKGGLDIGVDLPDDLPRLRADSRKLRQILLNLLSNGVKFTPEGGRVTVSAAVGPDGAMTLRVSDTGIGIAESNISVALEPFRQIDSRLSRKYDGTGLGLPLVMALAELHGAELRLESVEGEGTTASVRFPPERTVTAIPARLPDPLAQSATG